MSNNKRQTTRRTALKYAGIGAGVTLAGCLGGADDDDTIKVGASLALTGPVSQEGTWQERGYELWVQTLNERGGLIEPSDEQGLLGQEVELIVYDDESDPQRAVDLYQRLIEQDDVDILMGPYGSAISSAVVPIIEQAQMACIMPLMSDTSVLREQDIEYVLQAIAPAEDYLVGAVDIAVEAGAETGAIVHEDTAFPTDTAEGHVPYMEEQGLEVLHEDDYPEDTEDYTPILRALADDDVDVVLGGGYTPDALGLTTAAESLDMEPYMFSWMVGAMLPAFANEMGDRAVGITGDLFFNPEADLPYVDELVDLAIEEYDDVNEGWDIQSHLAGGFHGGLLFEKAIKEAGSLDQDDILEELRGIDTTQSDFGTPFGNGQFAVDDDGLQTAASVPLGQWQEVDGEVVIETVWPEEARTADPIVPHPGW